MGESGEDLQELERKDPTTYFVSRLIFFNTSYVSYLGATACGVTENPFLAHITTADCSLHR